ncbi:Cyanophycinase [Orchesella cincta]|uniref:Cyanophycinase n=1 Tax=Orchesella cincta TaxID=48709 RepID=A0A1D2NBL2_ORCCI|nr:Cyanophycinase [Orchesella cincta]
MKVVLNSHQYAVLGVFVLVISQTVSLPYEKNSVLYPSKRQIPSSNHFTTGKVFLLGGATDDKSSSIYNALRKSTGKVNPTIAVVISAASSLAVGLEAYYEPDEVSKSYEQLFTDYGFQPSVVLLAQDNYNEGGNVSTQLGAQNIEIIRNADVVFFNGGDQSRHTRSWFNDDGSDSDILHELRLRFASGETVIAGTSAGLAIQSNPTFGEGRSYGYYYFDADLKPCQIGESLLDDRQGQDSFRAQENGGYMKGFEFVRGALTDSHFDARGRFARLVVAMRATNKLFGVGVDEDTALFINQDNATVFGRYGVWIVNSTEASFTNSTQYFEATNVKINYLTEGDSFDISTGQLVTSKNLVTESDGEVYESEDIFDTDEALKSISSLATSASMASVGSSFETEPTARIVFQKTASTKFFKEGNNLAITNMQLDIGTM